MSHTPEGFGYYFEDVGRGDTDGPNDPSEEYFSGIALEDAIAREMIQNSLDARISENALVEVEFELREMDIAALPGVGGLRAALTRAVKANEKAQGVGRIAAAEKALAAESLQVLRIGDYGTKGLTGSECLSDSHSPLSVLTRSRGLSSNDGSRGGSFGIGSASGRLASAVRTVSYISLPHDKKEPVFASSVQAASFLDEEGTARLGTGKFMRLVSKDIEYPRGIDALEGFAARKAPGTDVYVLGYLRASDDPALHALRRSAVKSFMAAIHFKRLVVKGVAADGGWEVNSNNLGLVIDEDKELRDSVKPFYLALIGEDVAKATLPRLGEVRLHMRAESDRPKALGTQVMRKPLMRVDTYQHRLATPYAAVFVCEDKAGNELLRNIEPPQHNAWNHAGTRSDVTAVRDIKNFIRRSLVDFLPTQISTSTSIAGLANLLPVIGAELSGKPRGGGSNGDEVEPVPEESAAMLGKPEDLAALARQRLGRIGVTVTREGVSTPGGKETGFAGKRDGDGSPSGGGPKDNPSTLDPGDGSSRITSGDVSFRSFVASDGRTVALLTSAESISGDLELKAIGAGGQRFDLAIASVRKVDKLVKQMMSAEGSMIRGVTLQAGQTVRLEIEFVERGRYRLGVEDG